MPLDPTIANPATIKYADPMEQYGEYLKNSYLQSEIGKANSAASQNALINKAWQSPGALDQNGVANFGVVKNALASSGGGMAIPQLEMDQQNAAEKQGSANKNNKEAAKFEAETVGHALNNAKTQLDSILPDSPNGPQQMYDHIKANWSDKVLSKWMSDRRQTPQQDVSNLQSAVDNNTFPQLLLNEKIGIEKATANHITQSNLGGHTIVQSTKDNTFGAPIPTTISDNAETLNPNKPVTNINNTINNIPVKAANKWSETVADGLGKADLGKMASSEAAKPAIARLDDMRKLLEAGQVFTGPTGQLSMNVARLAKAAGFTVDDKGIVDTQVFNKEVSQNTMAQMAALKNSGVSLGRFTNNDLALLQSAGPDTALDPKTNLRLIDQLRQTHQDNERNWDTRLNDIQKDPQSMLDSTTRALVMNRTPLSPDYGAKAWPVPPQNTIDRLRSNPGEAALFEKHYGPGSAARAAQPNGGTPNGGNPLIPRR